MFRREYELLGRVPAGWVADGPRARGVRGCHDHALLGDQNDQTSLLATHAATQSFQTQGAPHELGPQVARERVRRDAASALCSNGYPRPKLLTLRIEFEVTGGPARRWRHHGGSPRKESPV